MPVRADKAAAMAQEAMDVWFACGQSIQLGAERLSLPLNTFGSRIKRAKELGMTPRTQKGEAILEARKEKPRVKVKAGGVYQSTVRVLVIGDAHDAPALDKSRFAWIGKHIAETRPDHIVSIGDFADLQSLCFHEANDTVEGKLKPFFLDDVASLERAMAAMMEPITKATDYRPKIDITLGNHENRLWRFQNANPEIFGMLEPELTNLYRRYGWTWHPFGKYLEIGGCDFVHIPLNSMGKGVSGKNAAATVALDSVRDIVIGHTHKSGVFTRQKLGQDRSVRVFDAGCALPQDHIEKYVGHAASGWWWGVTELIVGLDKVHGWNFMPMVELGRRYS